MLAKRKKINPIVLSLSVLVAFAAMAAVGCEPMTGSSTSGGGEVNRPTPATSTAEAKDVMVTVNGQPIYMEELNNILVPEYGLNVARQLIVMELVRQDAAAKGVTIDEKDIENEHDRTLKMILPTNVTDPRQQEELLTQYLQKNNTPRAVWNLSMRRNAYLRKMIGTLPEVPEAAIKDAFHSIYGRKLVLRDIQVDSAAKAQVLLNRIKSGADFAELAGQESMHPSAREGGLLPAVDQNSKDMPASIMEAARALKKVGDLSDIVMAGSTFHIIKLENVVDPQNVKLEDVRKEIVDELNDRQAQAKIQQMLTDMLSKAQKDGSIVYESQALKETVNKAEAQGR